MTATTMEQHPVLTGDIPLNPKNPFDKAQEQWKIDEHNRQVSALVADGYEVVRDTQTATPPRGTYQLVTWLMPSRQREQ
ncbi:hypothetical protein [Leifsonia aquatica]|uniref:hypothetical protein n=1 Tax=Leifsonia aquatica TaxID=144185 RepID=UPI00382F68E9